MKILKMMTIFLRTKIFSMKSMTWITSTLKLSMKFKAITYQKHKNLTFTKFVANKVFYLSLSSSVSRTTSLNFKDKPLS
jgi:hypothetical protein